MVTVGRAAWVVPTVRACHPALVAAATVAVLSAAAAVAAGANDVALPTMHAWLAIAALAVAAATPHDPAASLLAAVPTGSGRRLIHRGAVGTLTALGAWTLAGWSVDTLVTPPASDATIGGSVPALLALVTLATVIGSWFGPWGACTPLFLVAATHVVGDAGRFDDLLRLWWSHPWIVVAIALGAAAVRHRTAGR